MVFFFGAYVKDCIYILAHSVTLVELQERITAEFIIINRDMLMCMWAELEYNIDVCLVTNGGHIENL